jgi:hypothetical protein
MALVVVAGLAACSKDGAPIAAGSSSGSSAASNATGSSSGSSGSGTGGSSSGSSGSIAGGSSSGSSGTGAALPEHQTYADLPAALAAIIPADARVVGFGELHSRTDRGQVKSSLATFTDQALPALGPRLSDLVVETWVTDTKCGAAATEATTRVEMTMRRPVTTRNEIGDLAAAARNAGIQPHAMRIGCDDYARVAPPGKDVDVEALLTLTTRELGRLTSEAIAHPPNAKRPLIAVYGGALHNDRFPDPGVAEWSYAKAIDLATQDHFVEIDLIVPELAAADAASQKTAWFPLVATAAQVTVWKRGERSFVVILPRS